MHAEITLSPGQATFDGLPVDLRAVCQQVWDTVRKSEAGSAAQVDGVEILDDVAVKPLTSAQVGWIAASRRQEYVVAFASAGASVVWLVIACFVFKPSGELVLGAVPAIVLGFVMWALVYVDSRRGTLHWR